MTLTTTYTDANYDSFHSLADINAAVESLSGFVNVAKWNALTDPQKEGLILRAVEDVNSFDFLGAVNSSVVTPMQWPRRGTYYFNGIEIPEDTNPSFLKSYIARRVIEYLNTRVEYTDRTLPSIQSGSIGPLSRSVSSPPSRFRSVSDYPSYQSIEPWVVSGGGSGINVVNRA